MQQERILFVYSGYNNLLIEFLFFLTILVYPFSILGHKFFLIFQFTLLLYFGFYSILYIKANKYINLLTYFIFISGLFIVIYPFLVEFVLQGNFLLPLKILVNFVTLVFILLYVFFTKVKLSPQIVTLLKVTIYIHFFIVLFIHIKNGIPFFKIIEDFFVEGKITSAFLYGLAHPLKSVYITKNIVAMYFVTIISITIFLSIHFKRKLSFVFFIISFLLIFLFFSRQAFLSILLIYSFYGLFFSKSRFVKIISGIFLSVLIVLIIFILSIVGSLQNDGILERFQLWEYFFKTADFHLLHGVGYFQIKKVLLEAIGIDNYHLFFMNQISTYGIFHFILFNLVISLLFFLSLKKEKSSILPIMAFYLNILFQTFGYEFQNFIVCFILSFFIFDENSRKGYTLPDQI